MGKEFIYMDYEDNDSDVILKFDFKKKGYLWWEEVICNYRLFPLGTFEKKKITDQQLKELEDEIIPFFKCSINTYLINTAEKEGSYVFSIPLTCKKSILSKIIDRFTNPFVKTKNIFSNKVKWEYDYKSI